MARFTFLELHLHESELQFGPASIDGGDDKAPVELDDVDLPVSDVTGRIVPVVIGLAFLLGIGALIRRFRDVTAEETEAEAVEVEL